MEFSPAEKIAKLMRRGGVRLLYMYFPHEDGPDAGLLINRLDAEESLSRDYRYTVTALSDDWHIPANQVQGRMICVELKGEDGRSRFFNGYCQQFTRTAVENSLAHYELILTPWLAQFALRKTNCLFHRQSIQAQSKEIFLQSGMAQHDFRMRSADPERTYSCQFDETDHNYLHRRWEEMGWHYWYEHSLQGHRLILSDSSGHADPIDGAADVVWHHAGGDNRHDKILQWQPQHKLCSGSASLSSWDFKQPATQFAHASGAHDLGKASAREVYEYQDLYGFKDAAHGAQQAAVRVAQLQTEGVRIQGRSNVRRMQPGRWFRLQRDRLGQFLEDEAKEYLLVSVRHQADNNFLNEAGAAAQYENSFTCVPLQYDWRPGPGFNSHDVRMPGVDSATVIGPSGQEIHTDGFGRVKVRFHWDREGEQNTAWLRVSSQWAGGELGMMNLPRIGQEVLVQWLGGSPDRPIIIGSVYNARNMPPWRLPSQQALSGLRSRELQPGGGNGARGRSNHLILDDTQDNIQAQLKSDHACSQLSLGALTRIENNSGRRDARGEGWELATNAWGVARAGSGMLLTTEARDDVAGPAKSMAETMHRLYSAREQQQVLTKLAEQHGAQDEGQNEVLDKLKKQNQQIRGAPAGDDFPELAAPHLVLASPAGIASTTRKSTHICSDEHTALTTGKNLSIASGKNLFASIRNTFRLFVHKAGMKLIAAGGDIDIEALKNNINILAKLDIKQEAERITITAKEEVVINGGGSYIKLNAGGIEQGCKGPWVAHAATHSMVGPKNIPVKIELNPVKEEGPHEISVMALSAEGKALQDAVVTFFDPEQQKVLAKKVLDASGITEKVEAAHNQIYNALVGFEGWSVQFEEIVDELEELGEFDPGVLDEDRDSEHL
ncbi:type VI secretion system tip protein TssI/VgrG [Massilia sp. W12]|uniref:type VI secretion system Vgr family protein n=1 Tax=Massilia sp. W12 TaxID=3126507 RepID=UPI0030D22BBD